jgi:hypothetical protein
VHVIENPFHPVLQPDGSKLYTTTFGNTSSGVSVNIVGPRVYIDDIKASSFNDPRYLINPALKSGVFNLELNESFSYADITINYDPAKTTTPSNLALGYFNESTGNYTFVPSTVDTTRHTVTSRVTPADLAMSGSSIAALDPIQYHALPAKAQNEMGYMDIGANDNWTIYPPVDSYATTSFGNGASFPPGNYTILTSGTYTSYYVQYIGCINYVSADSNPDNTYGYYVNFNNPAGGYKQVQKLRVASGTLKVDHKGGPLSVYHSHIVNGVCGSVGYRLYYGDGPVFRDNESDFRNELNNDEFNATELGYDVAVTAYQAVAGCVLGQAGKKGGYLDSVHSAIPGWNDYINDDVTESPAYLVGQVACGIAFPYATLARDFSADLLRGDYAGAALESLGYYGKVTGYLKNSAVLATFFKKNAGREIKASHELIDFERKNMKVDNADELKELMADYRASTGYVLYQNVDDFNRIPGNLNPFDTSRGRTVIGYYKDPATQIQKWYLSVGNNLNANTLNINNAETYIGKTSTLNPVNQQILDCAIGKGDEIILANPLTLGDTTSTFSREVAYLKEFGYEISGSPTTYQYVDGQGLTQSYSLYTMIIPS